MTSRKRPGKRSRQRYPEAFKAGTVKLAEAVTRELNIQTPRIYA